MKICATTLLALAVAGLLWMSARAAESRPPVRFEAVHVYLDSQSEPLAAYQVFLRAKAGDVKIVGIEGGEPGVFKEPPFYDPKAMQHERVILAAFSTKPETELPSGRVRVATIHLQVSGPTEPDFEFNLQAAANSDGREISPTVSIEPIKP